MSVAESAEAVKTSLADSESGEQRMQLTFENVRLSHSLSADGLEDIAFLTVADVLL